jgi:GAF domain-containing protein
MDADTDLAGLVATTSAAPDLTTALDAVVSGLRQRFELWYACFASHPHDSTEVTVLAAWSLADSVLDTGAQVSATISPLVISALQTMREGAGARFAVGGEDSLIDHLLREQGVAAGLALPVHLDERTLLLLALGSSSPTAFQDAEPGFFSTLTSGIGPAVLRLATAANP